MAELDKFFNLMIEVGASDLHLASDSQPIVRVRLILLFAVRATLSR